MIVPSIEVILYDPAGRPIRREGPRPCRSYVKNYYNHLLSAMSGCTGSSAFDLHTRRVTGAINSVTYPWYHSLEAVGAIGGYVAAAGDALGGIVVGSSNAAENFGMGSTPAARSYSMGAKIASGDAAGQINYSLMEAPVVEKTGSSPQIWSVIHQRYFNNASGGDITVREIGLQQYAAGLETMVIRDILLADYTVAHAGQFLARFIFTLSIPSAI